MARDSFPREATQHASDTMLTTEELAALPIFSTLPPAKLGEVVKLAADIHLAPGEYAVHMGDDPALFVVISGLLEIVRLVDGIEQKLGERQPGVMHGEIPLVFGTQFQVSAKALEPTRVLRLEARHYYALAADAPEFAKTVRESAEYRISGPKGLKSIVAERRKPQVTMVGHRYDPSCVELRRFLTRNQITFEGVDVEDADLQARWQGPVPPEAELPTLRLADGTVLVKPQPRELAEQLGLQTRPNAEALRHGDHRRRAGRPRRGGVRRFRGAADAGVEREAPGGQAGTSSRIENYLGFPNGISGDELALRALRQAKRLGAEILVTRAIDRIDPDSARGSSRRRRRDLGADRDHRHRRELAPPRRRRLRPADRQGHLLRRGAERGGRDAGAWTST